jgi:hypothetical protein
LASQVGGVVFTVKQEEYPVPSDFVGMRRLETSADEQEYLDPTNYRLMSESGRVDTRWVMKFWSCPALDVEFAMTYRRSITKVTGMTGTVDVAPELEELLYVMVFGKYLRTTPPSPLTAEALAAWQSRVSDNNLSYKELLSGAIQAELDAVNRRVQNQVVMWTPEIELSDTYVSPEITE